MPPSCCNIAHMAFHRCPLQCMRPLPENEPDHLQSFLAVWHGACLFNSPPHSLQFPGHLPGRGRRASLSDSGTFSCGAVLPAGRTALGSGGSCLLHRATNRIVGCSIVLTSMPVLHGDAVLRFLPDGGPPGGNTQRVEPGKHAA